MNSPLETTITFSKEYYYKGPNLLIGIYFFRPVPFEKTAALISFCERSKYWHHKEKWKHSPFLVFFFLFSKLLFKFFQRPDLETGTRNTKSLTVFNPNHYVFPNWPHFYLLQTPFICLIYWLQMNWIS